MLNKEWYCDICQEKYTLKREHIKSDYHKSKEEYLEHVSEYENYRLCKEKGWIKNNRFMTFKEFVEKRQKERNNYIFSKEGFNFIKNMNLDIAVEFINNINLSNTII